MIKIKGVYKEGHVTLLEPVPPQVVEPQEVTVTFVDASPIEPNVPDEAAAAALALLGLLETMSDDEEEAFDAALKRQDAFFGPRDSSW
jgi:hypothetical protein